MEYDAWLWGKKEPFCSLSSHMIAVGACAAEYLRAESNVPIFSFIAERLGMEPDAAASTFSYVAAMHDIGKAHPSFQKSGNGSADTLYVLNYRHEQYGADMLCKLWRDGYGWGSGTAAFFAAVVRLHHQGKAESQARGNVPEEYRQYQQDLERRMRVLFTPVDRPGPIKNADAMGVLLSAILIICDWVASSDGFMEGEIGPDTDDAVVCRQLQERARTVLKRFGLISDRRYAYPRIKGFSSLWDFIPENSMRPLQRACEKVGEDKSILTIIEAPMGEGKTEAALYLADRLCSTYDKKGIYMALPTAATSNQMLGRVRAMLEEKDSGYVRLMHSMAWLIDDNTLSRREIDTEDAQYASDWLKPLRRGMLSENAVGTVDQAMAAVLRIKYGFLRLAGLASKVLVIDEIHAYDIFMSTIIARLLEWCRALEIPVILLSATMQDRQKARYLKSYGIENADLLTAYPLITQVRSDGELVQIPVSGAHMSGTIIFRTAPVGNGITETADLVFKRAENGGCICVLMNTVKQAQDLYREIKKRGERNIMLFHARYTADRRAQIERQCMDLFGKGGNRPKRMILICTQVIEQSLDVDFDTMITQIAPMDLLLQRAGRVHRHDGNARPAGMSGPVIDVLVPAAGQTIDLNTKYAQIASVYSPIVLKNTEDLLGTEKAVTVPGQIRECVETAYAQVSGEQIDELAISMQIDRQLKQFSAEGELLRDPRDNSFFGSIRSLVRDLNMAESDDPLFVRGAHTRDGRGSQQFVFLPHGFPENDGSKSWIKKAMGYMCSYPLTKTVEDAIMHSNKGKHEISNCIVLRETEEGVYRLGDLIFSVTDEYGIEEVK